MKYFKKRTLALMLASFVTVTGTFAEENYKNSILGMAFERLENGSINLTLETKKPPTSTPQLVQRDKNTYIIMLPEINNQASSPDLSEFSADIENINVRTMPYSNNSKGYTKITIKTYENASLSTSCKLFIPGETQKSLSVNTRNTYNNTKMYNGVQDFAPSNKPNVENEFTSRPRAGMKQVQQEINVVVKDNQNITIDEEDAQLLQEEEEINTENNENQNNTNYSANNAQEQQSILVLWLALIALVIVFIYLKAKDKIVDVVGENLQIDIDSKNNIKQQKESTKNKIKSTIKKLDEKYPAKSYQQTQTKKEEHISVNVDTEWKKEENINIVDLDELFQKQNNIKIIKNTEAPTDLDLDDFFSEFSSSSSTKTEEEAQKEIEKAEKYNEELYNKILKNKNIRFTDNDIKCINELMSAEIYEDTINNIEKYVASNPINTDKNSVREKLFEKFILDYTIMQNITFTEEDVKTLHDLINIEIDNDFITDLRTNPIRTKEMEDAINKSAERKSPKPTEILTLHISDKLPDLAEALKKQGNRPIKSEAKPEVIYYSEGYEVETLTLDFDLPDLSKEINNKSAYEFKQSEAYNVVDTSYQVETLKIDMDLPDLNDVMKNPEKYKEQDKEPVVIDMDKILQGLDNVQLKPFYDGTEAFEVLNHFDDADNNSEKFDDTNDDEKYITNDDLIIKEEKEEKEKEKEEEGKISKNAKFETIKENINIRKERRKLTRENYKNRSHDLIEKIKSSKNLKEKKRIQNTENKTVLSTSESNTKNNKNSAPLIKYIINGITYHVINTAKINDNLGFYLAKQSDMYVLLSYKNDDIKVIKEYKELHTKLLKIRQERSQAGSVQRYLMRLGMDKFVVSVENNEITDVINL